MSFCSRIQSMCEAVHRSRSCGVTWRRRRPGPCVSTAVGDRPQIRHPPGLGGVDAIDPFADVSPDTLATCARRSILLASHRGVVPKPTTDRGNILLSESTVRTTLKITSAVAAALAFSLAAAGTALADELGADASGGGDFGFGVSGPTLPPPPPPPALPAPTASASGGTGVGVDTPLGSGEGGFATDLGVGLPTLPPPPPPPPLPSASGSTQTNLGFGF
ncbi:MAG: hypothetical protein QOD36_2884 [Mycobacterium sp.]|nr:hypothetical protein [Mycobacterium sp.]